MTPSLASEQAARPLSCVADTAPRTAGCTGPRVGFALQPLQVGTHVCSVLVAQITIFFQSLINDVFQFWRKVRVQTNRRNWIARQNFMTNHSRTFSAKRQDSRGHLVEHRAEGKQIAARIEFLGPHLLRRHIGDGAKRRAGTGQVLVGCRGCLCRCSRCFERAG